MVEHLGFTRGGRWDKVLLKDLEDVLADLGKLGLDLLTVVSDHLDLGVVSLALLLLLDGGDDSPRGSSGTDDVLLRNGEEVSLLNGKLLVGRGDGLHVLDHFYSVSLIPTRARKAHPRSARPAQQAWRGRRSLHGWTSER